MGAADGILLESGTNEVEMLEFALQDQSFGVNVLKIQAIEQFDPQRVTAVPLAHPSVVGSYGFRDAVVTLVDLGFELGIRDTAIVLDQPGSDGDAETRIVLVMEFNGLTTAFLVDGVNRIHRVSWESISALSPFLSACSSKFTGSLNIESREIMVVDMERVVVDVLPRAQQLHRVIDDSSIPCYARRATVPVLLAEDSGTIRETVRAELQRGNYQQVHAFANGSDALTALTAFAERAASERRPLTEYVGAVVTDIEMPQMDGLALCKTIKQTPGLCDLPVIMFSSLINEQIAAKCLSVHADATISKPQFNELVHLLDKHALACP